MSSIQLQRVGSGVGGIAVASRRKMVEVVGRSLPETVVNEKTDLQEDCVVVVGVYSAIAVEAGWICAI